MELPCRIAISGWLLLVAFSGISTGGSDRPYLSNLQTTATDPLFTTYCAELARAEFTLDQGYHFRFYEPNHGLEFVTDTAGDWGVAFVRDGHACYRLADLAAPPVITMSYPDLIRYHFRPYPDLRVEATFVVYSSRGAVQELRIHNTGQRPVALRVAPYLHHRQHSFDRVTLHAADGALSASHEERPDAWMMGHDIPVVNPVGDAFVVTGQPAQPMAYRRFSPGTVALPRFTDQTRTPVCVIWGALRHTDGERCTHTHPAPVCLVTVNGRSDRILTETAPAWGEPAETLSPYGYYRVELGHFPDLKNEDTYTVRLFCRETGRQAVITGRVTELASRPRMRRDAVLDRPAIVPAPGPVTWSISPDGRSLRLQWPPLPPGFTGRVYRRDGPADGSYELLADRLTPPGYTDPDISGLAAPGYLVVAVDEQGRPGPHSGEIAALGGPDFLTDILHPHTGHVPPPDFSRVLSLTIDMELPPGTGKVLRMARVVGRPERQNAVQLVREGRALTALDFGPLIRAAEARFQRIPVLIFDSAVEEMVYWSAFSLMRQVMLPPEGRCRYNYYVFSREPTWGWGHGGQVFHESLAMLAYALMDPRGAMDSQRVYAERQHADGYINYRTGPWLDETIPTNGQLTTSAPWYAWTNYEIWRLTGDRLFLEEMYDSSRKFYNYVLADRDSDGDGLAEWGAHAVLESVRDAHVAVWDEVDWPTRFEALDLNCMLVREARALAAMARELGRAEEADTLETAADARSARINETFWDEATGFYYHVDRTDHDFSVHQTNDLKREEIIGFLPLWAGVADKDKARRLVSKLTDPAKFWRPFGVPSLAADDPYYNPKGYWNGPVWVEWNYLMMRGLLDYGYTAEARELVRRITAGVAAQLRKNHTFWEFTSPDEPWAGYHNTYIWTGLISRMLRDVQPVATHLPAGRKEDHHAPTDR
ncbi:MAG: hypothetical protein JXQ27_10170 [Acidobacteria bacterium]|nr:hypothetical protein [Acidobacteriota bacterium]